jgi:uncharacterized protein (TIGR03067 family)
MKTRLSVLMLLGMALASAGVAFGGDTKAEMKKFEGTWAVESSRVQGKDAPAETIKWERVIFRGGKATFVKNDGEKVEATYKIDPARKPPHIDLTFGGITGPPGIYAFEGGKLTICFGEERPVKFESPAGSKTMLLVLKRAKEKK